MSFEDDVSEGIATRVREACCEADVPISAAVALKGKGQLKLCRAIEKLEERTPESISNVQVALRGCEDCQ